LKIKQGGFIDNAEEFREFLENPTDTYSIDPGFFGYMVRKNSPESTGPVPVLENALTEEIINQILYGSEDWNYKDEDKEDYINSAIAKATNAATKRKREIYYTIATAKDDGG
jgi:hypothetical protein